MEVYELLVKEEIHQLIFWLCRDQSFKDEREGENEKPSMKMPYLISGYEIDQVLGNKLFKRVYHLDPIKTGTCHNIIHDQEVK